MATEKMLRITMPDLSVWEVPAKVVASNRAHYYAERDDDADFDGEFDFAMGDEYTLTDWAAGNMNWDDVEAHARKVRDRAPMDPGDYQEGWVNGDKEVVEVEVPDVIDAEFPDPEPVVFTCRDCGEEVEVSRVRCAACVAKKGPTV